MTRIHRWMAAGILFAAATLVCPAETISWTGPSDFDSAQILFAGFNAGELSGITSDGAYFHDHGVAPTTFTLSVQLNGTWTPLGSFVSAADNTANDLSTIIPLPAFFPLGVVSGIELSADPVVGSGFHNFSTGTSFVFATPEPAGMALLGSGLLGLACLRFRRRK